eukprot:8046740-Alexandrium_andersonii.AAC.1
MDEFTVCQEPQCVFIGRTHKWVQNVSRPGGHIACPRCGKRYRRDRVFREDHNITPFNKVSVFHSD